MKEDYLRAYESTMTDADKADREIKRPKPDGKCIATHSPLNKIYRVSIHLEFVFFSDRSPTDDAH